MANENRGRSANLAKNDEEIRDHLSRLYDDIEKGFQDQHDRANDIEAFWNIYNCKLDQGQLYSGRNRLYMPIVYEAIEARAARYVNQLFPESDRHIEAISTDSTLPRAAVAVCEHYIQNANLSEVMMSLCRSGDVEGQYNLYVSWEESHRHTVSRVSLPPEITQILPGAEALDILQSDEAGGAPKVEVLSDVDICILPATALSLDDALTTGGSVTIVRRWTKQQIENMASQGVLDEEEVETLVSSLDEFNDENLKDSTKATLRVAGIKKDGRGKYAQVFEIWTELEVREDEESESSERRLCQVFMLAKDKILMARRNPLWCDRCPLLSVPVKREFGSVKGISMIKPVQRLQYLATDVLNEGADSANYSLLPITFRDPAYITSPLILSPGAVWDVPPGGAAFADMPPLWQHAMEI
ncbi:MAG: hypothetical protein MN733_28160, partial [Nitrososphaera sp.]|nr:hypothetical protein [Nitrososphaera sp.]